MTDTQKRISKFLSLVLRHRPEKIGITLDPAGWARVDQMLDGFRKNGLTLSRKELEEVVRQSNKQRFTLSDDGEFIRANYGHSIPVDLQYETKPPPEFLFHGTAQRFVESIRQNGLTSQNRQFVHLSIVETSAMQVGKRHGKPVILLIKAEQMFRNGFQFYQSDSGIWLTKNVPADYIIFPE